TFPGQRHPHRRRRTCGARNDTRPGGDGRTARQTRVRHLGASAPPALRRPPAEYCGAECEKFRKDWLGWRSPIPGSACGSAPGLMPATRDRPCTARQRAAVVEMLYSQTEVREYDLIADWYGSDRGKVGVAEALAVAVTLRA